MDVVGVSTPGPRTVDHAVAGNGIVVERADELAFLAARNLELRVVGVVARGFRRRGLVHGRELAAHLNAVVEANRQILPGLGHSDGGNFRLNR